MPTHWISDARDQLLRLRKPHAGWSYRPDGEPFTEPTAWGALALRATVGGESMSETSTEELEACDWLASIQQHDGAFGPSGNLPFPHWPTAPALLAWGDRERFSAARKKAVEWLLTHQGSIQTSTDSPFGHDASIPGWPWVEGTHSWLEPTAMAVLALRQQGEANHPRVREGLRLIRDRTVRTGGWNYGNSSVFGTDLRPQPAPTGLALLALHGTMSADEPVVERACTYLEKMLPTTRSPQSLCWGLLALSAWDRNPAARDEWLAAAFATISRRSDLTIQLAYLLLGAADQLLPLIRQKN